MEKYKLTPSPLVSVITPAYNAEKYLGEAIVSVMAQTYPRWELIIAVDGGSRDGTLGVARAWAEKDKRVRYFPHSHRRMAAARNFALAQAQGEYVAFLDADNLFLPEKLERQVKFMETHPECGLCYGSIYHFYQSSPELLYRNKNELPELWDDVFLQTLHANFLNVLSVLVRRDALDISGRFPEGWPACDEQYVWVNLAYRGVQFRRSPGAVGLLRLHGKNDSLRPGHILDTATAFLTLLDIVEKRLTPEERKKYSAEIALLRRLWKKKKLVGKLLANHLTSWFFMFWYRRKRERAYRFVGERSAVLAQ